MKSTRRRGDEATGRSTAFLLLVAFLIAMASACHRDAEQSLTRAVEAWDSGDYKVAAEEYERYLYQHPTGDKAPEARFQLANIYYFKLQRYDQARANYTAFLEQNSSSSNAPLARERLAEVLAEMGRSYEAIAEYENLSPQDANERRRIRLRIADLYFAQRNYSQALTEYDKVIEGVGYDELSEQAYLREASVYHIARGQYQQALPIYEKLGALTADPKVRVRSAYARAECYAGLYQLDEAIKTLHSIKDESEQADVSRRIAELETRRQEAARARSGLDANGRKPERGKPEVAEAIKTEPVSPVTADKSPVGKTENKKSEKTDAAQTGNSNKATKRKADTAQTSNANAPTKRRTQKAENAQPTNTNSAKKPGSKKADNAPAGNENGRKTKPQKAANANR